MITEHDRRWLAPLLWFGFGVAVGLLICLPVARSETPSAGIAYCSLWARESARIDLMHTVPAKPENVTDAYIEQLAVRLFKECISIIPALLPLPEQHRSLKVWVNDMRVLMMQRVGTVPATEKPISSDEEWKAACESEYRSWDEATGTVVRSGSEGRVRCPLVKENGEWVIRDSSSTQ